jgi:hypothetical protein
MAAMMGLYVAAPEKCLELSAIFIKLGTADGYGK